MSAATGKFTKYPKVLLHDHLDGGLRPLTVVELAAEYGYRNLPTTDVEALAHWFHRGAKRNDLVLYLETFAHTVGVMQHRDAIERVAFECAQDLAADGVVYAEVRCAPELHTEAGLTLNEVVQAVMDGLQRGASGTDLTVYVLLCAMRTAARSLEIANDRHRRSGPLPAAGSGPHQNRVEPRQLQDFLHRAAGHAHQAFAPGRAGLALGLEQHPDAGGAEKRDPAEIEGDPLLAPAHLTGHGVPQFTGRLGVEPAGYGELNPVVLRHALDADFHA